MYSLLRQLIFYVDPQSRLSYFFPVCRDASKQNLAEKDGCLKTKNLAKTILAPLESGANEVRHENQTGDL
jgi:hypothetical protein